jgi:NADH-quinone oxidoreductase subunit E
MFKLEPVGRYVVNVCTNISCQLLGAEELLEHAEEQLGVRPGGTTADGLITLEDVECIAACTEAPCLQVNYRYFNRVSNDDFDQLVDDLRSGRLDETVPPHGTVARIRQRIPADLRAGAVPPEGQSRPVWLPAPEGGDGS